MWQLAIFNESNLKFVDEQRGKAEKKKFIFVKMIATFAYLQQLKFENLKRKFSCQGGYVLKEVNCKMECYATPIRGK